MFFKRALLMNLIGNLLERIITKAHQVISGQPISSYKLDFSNLLYSKDPELSKLFHHVGNSAAYLAVNKKLRTLVMEYDTLCFCIRFTANNNWNDLNLRMISESIEEIPQSTGHPTFVAGTEEPTSGAGWKFSPRCTDTEVSAEIFPLIDFEGLCFYYAKIIADTPRSFKIPSGDSQSSSNGSIRQNQYAFDLESLSGHS